MTIMKNKPAKASQSRSETEDDESPQHTSNVAHSQARTVDIQVEDISSHGQERVRDLPSSHNWQVPTREEKRSPRNEYSLDDTTETGPSHSKRRHKASPLRSRRTSKVDRSSSASPPPSTSYDNAIDDDTAYEDDAPAARTQPDYDGYNSGDEYEHSQKLVTTSQEWTEKDNLFEKIMLKSGFIIKPMAEDGACLFRAVADQVYGDQDMHALVRKSCMDYMATNSDYFSQYVTEDFNNYLSRKRQAYTHGNHVELQAMCEIYNRKIEVYCYGIEPINTFHGGEPNDYEPIRLSYQRGSHYNSIVDPHKPTMGCGLGLPSLTHVSDPNLIKEELRKREDFNIEQAMLEDKLRATDWEATNEAIEEQIARESYLQWLRDNEKRDQEKLQYGAGSTYDQPGTHRTCRSSPCPSPRLSEKEDHYSVNEKNQIDSHLFGLPNWEDNILAQVLAASQQEYLDNLSQSPGNCSKKNDFDKNVQPSTSR